MRVARIALIAIASVVVLLIAAATYVATLDFDRFRPLLAEQLKAATGRDVAIGGRLDLELSMTPTLEVSDVRFANAPGGTRPDMATIARLEAKIALLPLLSRRLQIDRFALTGADVLLETDREGRGNGRSGATQTLVLASLALRAVDEGGALDIALSGAADAVPLTVTGKTGGIDA